VDVRDITLAWQPWSLLHGTLEVNRLAAASVQVNDQRASSTTPSVPPSALGLPLPVVLDGFSIGQFQWTGGAAFSASGITGNYAFKGIDHQLELLSAQVARGRYNGRATLSSRSPLKLDASLAGALDTQIPGTKAPVPLAFKATARGPLTELLVKAELQMSAQPSPASPQKNQPQPQATATARVMPWAAQPLPQADANFRDLDVAAFWPEGPQTLLTGSASVRPAEAAGHNPPGCCNCNWPTPCPARGTSTSCLWIDWRPKANGAAARPWCAHSRRNWAVASCWPAANGPMRPSFLLPFHHAQHGTRWKLQATLQHINPALLHSQLAPLPLDGKADVRSQGAAIALTRTCRPRAMTPVPKTIPSATAPARCQRHRQLERRTSRWHPGVVGPARAHRRRRTGRPAGSPAQRQGRQRKAHTHGPRAGRPAARRAAANQRQGRCEPARPRHGASPCAGCKNSRACPPH
jgi:translocation and assembly module TamB